MLSIDSDLGRHLVIGEYILAKHIVPTRDLFSSTLPNHSRPPYEWLSQILLAFSQRLLGLDGVILLTALVLGLVFVLILKDSIHRSRSPLISISVTLIAVAASSIHWLPRPHILSFLLFALWMEKLERLRSNEKIDIFLLPILMLFWANLHGGFIFGFLALLAYGVGWLWDARKQTPDYELGKKIVLTGGLSAAASIVTPDLWHNWEAVLNNHSAFILSRTVETMNPNLSDLSIAPFIILVTLTSVFSAANWRDLSASHVLILSGTGFMAILMTRNIPIFSIACAPILAKWIAKKLEAIPAWQKFDGRFVNFTVLFRFSILPIWIVVLTFGYILNAHSQGRQIFQFNQQVFPVQAVNWLEKHPMEGNMFNEFNWGGYLLYRLWPRSLVFVDSQSDFYGESLMREYVDILSAQDDWSNLLEKYHVDWVIIPTNSPLAGFLVTEPGWAVAYQDTVAIIIQKR